MIQKGPNAMKPGVSAAILRDSQALFVAGSVAGLEDEQLLNRFAAGLGVVSELAFAALVSRHGPMVLATCRRSLGDFHQADDAFQATFLVLAKRARSVRGQSLGPWLYGVARKVCGKARGDRDRRAVRQASLPPGIRGEADPTDLAHQSELRDLIDRELARIPARLREAIVLCDLQGLSHDEAARQVGCPAGTIKSRQARGRARLRDRLEKLGLDPAALASPAAMVSSRLASSVGSAALHFQQGGLIAAGVGPAAVALSFSTLRELSMIHLVKMTTAAAVGLGTLAAATVVQDPSVLPTAPAQASPAPTPSPSPTPLPAPQPGSPPIFIPTVNAQDPARPDSILPTPHPGQPSLALPTPAATSPATPQPVPSPAAAVGPFVLQAQRDAILPPVDRLQSLEQKLDRLLSALERPTRNGAARPAPSDHAEASGMSEVPPELASRNDPVAQPPTEKSTTSLEARLAALENRVDQIEKNTTRKMEVLEGYLQELHMRVTGAPLKPTNQGFTRTSRSVRGNEARDHQTLLPVDDDLPPEIKLEPANANAPPATRRAPR